MVRLHLHRRGQFDETHRIGPASWPYFDLLWIHKGHVCIRFQSRQKARLHAGQGVLIYPHTRFEGYSVTPKTQASVQHFELLAPADELPPPFSEMTKLRRGYEPYVHPRAARLQADVDRAMELARREHTPLLQAMRVGLLTLLLGELHGHARPLLNPARQAHPLDELTRFAQQHLDEGICVKDLARQAGLSPSHFRALFTRAIGVSAGRFLQDLRVVEAKRLLHETLEPIKEISQLVGYSDVVSFHRAFKSRTGQTPADYRVSHRLSG
jgi:AraC-like DNA-binding protein